MRRWIFYLNVILLVLVGALPSVTATGSTLPQITLLQVGGQGNAAEEEEEGIVVFSDTTSNSVYDDGYTIDDEMYDAADGDEVQAGWWEELITSLPVRMLWWPFEVILFMLRMLPQPIRGIILVLLIAGVVCLLTFWVIRRRKTRRAGETVLSPRTTSDYKVPTGNTSTDNGQVMYVRMSDAPHTASLHNKPVKTYYYDAPMLMRGIRQMAAGVALLILELWIGLWYVAGVLGVFVMCMAVARIIIAMLPHWRAMHTDPRYESPDERAER